MVSMQIICYTLLPVLILLYQSRGTALMPASKIAMYSNIVGYLALIGWDDMKAVRLLRQIRNLHKKFLRRHNGHLLGVMDDGVYSWFSHLDDGVRCAIAIQESLISDPNLSLRIGLHSGSIRQDSQGFYGVGVLAAGALESYAEIGGVCISGELYDALADLPGFTTVFLGKHAGKRLPGLTRVYALSGPGLAQPKRPRRTSSSRPMHSLPTHRR